MFSPSQICLIDILCKCNHILCSFFTSGFFNSDLFFDIYPFCSKFASFRCWMLFSFWLCLRFFLCFNVLWQYYLSCLRFTGIYKSKILQLLQNSQSSSFWILTSTLFSLFVFLELWYILILGLLILSLTSFNFLPYFLSCSILWKISLDFYMNPVVFSFSIFNLLLNLYVEFLYPNIYFFSIGRNVLFLCQKCLITFLFIHYFYFLICSLSLTLILYLVSDNSNVWNFCTTKSAICRVW